MGSGSWGTAFAHGARRRRHRRRALGQGRRGRRRAVNADHENPEYHPGIALPATLRATTDAAEALAAPTSSCWPSRRRRCAPTSPAGAPTCRPTRVLVSLMKGIELGTTMRMSEVVARGHRRPGQRGSPWCPGPNLAREIAQRQPAATVVACTDEATTPGSCRQACLTPYFRPYTNPDVVGIELGGAVKNVIALANGVAVGLGFGDNTQASLITRGLAEMARLGVALGADPMTFAGLAGVGDLVATCTSPLSRNRTFGENLGSGMTGRGDDRADPADLRGRQVLPSDPRAGRAHGVDMPITEQVVRGRARRARAAGDGSVADDPRRQGRGR